MNVLELFKKITTFVFDVDGVLTDGTVLVLENGVQARRMNIKDGLALQMALRNGFRILVISGGHSKPVVERLNKLGVQDVYMSVSDKKDFIRKYISEKKLNLEEFLFMADDLPDLELLESVGVASCPADAVREVKEIAQYISPMKGGYGCVRDIIEKVLKVQGKWIFDKTVTSR
ncbi:MAG: HAD hydrolase family protein [Bacteroidetes bacterium]|nr:HAD hydrolase family protein [Bacteroidota bacterium]MBS1610593.1 HAD hydrolase family protein [Bacteroidota bacterium]